MKYKPLRYSVREQTEIIRNCQSLYEMQILMRNLESEFESYSISDQGFLLTMVGMAIMKMSDDSHLSNLYESKIKLLMLSRINYGEVKEKKVSQNDIMQDHEDSFLFV